MIFAAIAALAACGPRVEDQGSGGVPEADSVSGVRDMLRRRASALLRGDRQGFLEPLSEQARAVETAVADGAPRVPLAAFNFIFKPEGGRSPDTARFTGVRTHVTYHYRGLPEDNLFFYTMSYDLQRTARGWTIAKSVVDPDGPLPVWARGPVEIRSSKHFLVMHRPGVPRIEEAVTLAERARSEVVGKLTLVPDGRHLLILAADHTQFEEMEGQPVPAGVLALAGFSQGGQEVPRSRYLLVDLDETLLDPARKVATHSGDIVPIEVFRHELGHMALLRYTTPITSGWVIEGAAMYLSGEQRKEAWREYVHTGRFNEIDIAGLSSESNLPGEAYPYANAAVLHLVDAHGPAKFWDFYRSFKRIDFDDPAPKLIAAASEQQLRKIYGLTPQQLDAATRRWITAHAA